MKNLPVMEHTFEVNLKGKMTGQIFKGPFTYKRLDIGSQGKAAVLKTRLNGDLSNIDAETDLLHEMISWLRYGLIEFPDWWRDTGYGTELYDINIIEHLYKEVTKFEKNWVEKIKDAQPDTNNSSQ